MSLALRNRVVRAPPRDVHEVPHPSEPRAAGVTVTRALPLRGSPPSRTEVPRTLATTRQCAWAGKERITSIGNRVREIGEQNPRPYRESRILDKDVDPTRTLLGVHAVAST